MRASLSVSASSVSRTHDRDRGQAGELGRAQSSFARDQLVAGARLADHDRLQDPDLADRDGERCDRFVVEVRSGLLGVGGDRVHGHLEQPGGLPASGAPGISADSPRPNPPRLDITRLPCGTVAIGACRGPPPPQASAPIDVTPGGEVGSSSATACGAGLEDAGSASSSMTTTRRSGRCSGGVAVGAVRGSGRRTRGGSLGGTDSSGSSHTSSSSIGAGTGLAFFGGDLR